MSLAELSPAREKDYLQLAAADRYPPAAALIRLSLLAELAGALPESVQWMDAALAARRQYKTYFAALSQAARLGDEARFLRLGPATLSLCPGSADAVFHLLAAHPRGAQIVQTAPIQRREDYLRYLIGQEKYLEALEYQGSLGRGPLVEGYRRDLAERLILNGLWAEAARLHPRPETGGVQNARFEAEPTSLAFDWRLAQGEGVSFDWRPGQLAVRIGRVSAPKELLSQFVRCPGEREPTLIPRWSGEVRGLVWRQERVHPEWVRVALIAEAGVEREFQLEEVKLRGGGG